MHRLRYHNLVELIRIENKTAEHVCRKFEECWLNRYPRPNKCIHDNGGEFIGWKFQNKLTQLLHVIYKQMQFVKDYTKQWRMYYAQQLWIIHKQT